MGSQLCRSNEPPSEIAPGASPRLERAHAVKGWLVKNGNVLAANISTKGFGEAYAIAPNKNQDGSDNPLGRALNRRVSIIVEKQAGPTPSLP